MTTDKYQQPHTPALRSPTCPAKLLERSRKGEAGCPLEERMKGLQSDVSEIRGMVGGMYDRVNELVETTGAIHDMVKYAGEPKCNHSDDDWDFLDEEE